MVYASSSDSDGMRAPLSTQQLHPIMLRFFNPTPISAFDMESSILFEQSYASLNMFDSVPNGKFLVDTELYVPSLDLRYRLNPQHRMNIRIPFYRPYNGVLDHALRQYHQLVGLPNNGREFRPSNQMGYYLRPEWTAQNRWEMGNISLELQSQVYQTDHLAVAILSSMYLPTSSKARGWSSGGIDLSLGTTMSWYGEHYFAHAELRAIRTGAASEGTLVYKDYLRTSIAVGREFGQKYSALIQIQGGSSPYQSDLFVLDQNPWVLLFGWRIRGDSALYSLNFSENITQYTTADFSFGFNIRWLLP